MTRSTTHDPVRLARIFFLGLLLAGASGSVLARQATELAVRAATATMVVKPGAVATTGIVIRNGGLRSRKLTSQVTVPRGWRVLTGDGTFDVGGGASDLRLLSLAVPVEAAAGEYSVRYAVHDGDQMAEAIVRVTVPALVRLGLTVLEAPKFVRAGEVFRTRFALTNAGNAGTHIRLSSRSSHNFDIQLDSPLIVLGPRETREIVARTALPARTERLSHTLELTVTAIPDSSISASASSVVSVIPLPSDSRDQYVEYPLTVRARGVGQGNAFAPQIEVSGVGSLNDTRTDRLEVLVRAPETQSRSVLGQRDEYRMRYQSKDIELFAGDLNYALTPLTEMGRYATGFGGRFVAGRFGAGGFYNTIRWFTPRQKEMGGYVSVEAVKGSSLSLNYLRKDQQTTNDLASIRGLSTIVPGSTIDVEYAGSDANGVRDHALATRFDGAQSWISYDLRYVTAGKGFAGYYRDLNFYSGSFNLRPGSRFRIEGYVRQEERNLGRDTNQIYAPRDRYLQIGGGYADLITLYYRYTSQEDLFPASKYRRHEDAVQARVGHNFDAVSIFADADVGSVRDDLQARAFPSSRYSLSVGLRPAGTLNMTSSIEYASDQSVYTNESQDRTSAAISTSLLLGQATMAEVNGYLSRIRSSTDQTYALVEGSVEHVFPFNHTISLRGRYSAIATTTTVADVAYVIEYAIPVAIPVRRITSAGTVNGRITDEAGGPLPNVLVSAGTGAAVTGGQGEYSLTGLKPGAVYLTVDQASIGLDRITLEQLPMEVLIEGGMDVRRDLHVTRSVGVQGSVLLFDNAAREFGGDSTAIVERGGRAGLFVELSNGSDVLRRVTDNRGRFAFADLRPGTWIVRIAGGDVPPLHVVTPDSIRLVLRPAERTEVTFELRPRRRAIRMLEQGQVLKEEKSAAPVTPVRPPEAPTPAPRASESAKLPAPAQVKLMEAFRPTCLVYYDARRKGYVVQTSSWTTRSKANRVAREIEAIIGYPVSVEPATVLELGIRYHVLIGPFRTRAEAVALCPEMSNRSGLH